MARPSIYSQELADTICGRIVDGESLRAICRDDEMPAASSVFKWLREHPEFSEQYAKAKAEQAEGFADEIVSIADEECTMIRADKHGTRADHDENGEALTEVVFDATAVARNRLRVDARKWVSAKLLPKKYGDKLDLNHSGETATNLTVTFKG